ncbi:hypothetical protein AX14_011493 [Amanita brunnescens Koide BX004]|nr:hypothetical protein AX14_011493 [Amanita brunnescens Koide BX004]
MSATGALATKAVSDISHQYATLAVCLAPSVLQAWSQIHFSQHGLDPPSKEPVCNTLPSLRPSQAFEAGNTCPAFHLQSRLESLTFPLLLILAFSSILSAQWALLAALTLPIPPVPSLPPNYSQKGKLLS